MKERKNVGDEVYCTSPKERSAFKATVVSQYISPESGYLMYAVVTEKDEKKRFESAHIHNTKDEAKDFLDKILPFIDEADAIIKKATELVDHFRIKVIGEPDDEALAERLKPKEQN